MNDTIQIPIELSYSLASSAAGGGVTMMHLILLVLGVGLLALFFMIMQSNARAEKQDILRTVEKQETERQWKENFSEKMADLRSQLQAEALKRRGAEDKADFTRTKVGA